MNVDPLVPFAFDEEEAFAIAQRDLWDKVGNFCYPTNPKSSSEVMEFDVNADLPQLHFDPVAGTPSKVRYFRFEKVGKVRVRLNNGTIEGRTGWRETKRNIRERMNVVETSVEQAVLRQGAGRFSQLPFSEHMHTPLVDILSYLAYEERLELEYWKTHLRQEKDELKFTEYLSLLEQVDLARKDGPHVVPGNVFVGLLEKYDRAPDVLRGAMHHFFSEGVENIDSVRRVIGPQLKLSAKVYGAALEWGGDVRIDQEALHVEFANAYSGDTKKALQFGRYLMQLERVNLVQVSPRGGTSVVQVNEELFDEVNSTGDLLSPFRSALLEAV